jgi:hypothetical protein
VDPRTGLNNMEKRTFLPPLGLELRPVASRYTDYAIPALNSTPTKLRKFSLWNFPTLLLIPPDLTLIRSTKFHTHIKEQVNYRYVYFSLYVSVWESNVAHIIESFRSRDDLYFKSINYGKLQVLTTRIFYLCA